MKDVRGDIIYVGKAKNLKLRVRNYFTKAGHEDPKTSALVHDTYDLDVIVTGTEVDALMLERTLIKHHKPQYNVLLRDDKEYPYLRIDFHEDWPRIEKVRRRKDDAAQYLGPFGSAGQLKIMLDATYRIFPLIRCSRHEFKNAKRPCNYYHMKMCLGPCTLDIERQRYETMMKDAVAFLQGRKKSLVDTLQLRMRDAAKQEQFEWAAILRDQLHAFKSITEKQSVVVEELENGDVIGIHQDRGKTCFQVLTIRDHYLVSKDSFVLASPIENKQESLSDFLLQYYDARSLPDEIIVPDNSMTGDDRTLLAMALMRQHPDSRSLKIIEATSGSRLDLIDIANKNAALRFDEVMRLGHRIRIELEIIQDKLDLKNFPRRMECIDISNIQGSAIVASDVCFIDGKPAKQFYRHYSIKDVTTGPDDYASIREVVRRRLERGLRDEDLPDLLVIDGGKGQLTAARSVCDDYKGLKLDLISLAKSRVAKKRRKRQFIDAGNPERSFERVFFADRDLPLALAPGTPEYRLLTQIRDEAHRFAITHHRKRRAKIFQGSVLEDVPGIGPKIRQRLLETFGSLEAVKNASFDQLKNIKGLSETSAVLLYNHLNPEE